MDQNDRALTAFTMIAHAMFHTYELVIPIFVVLWLAAFDVSPAVIGLVVGVSYGFVGVGALPTGILSDRYSAKRLIVACMFGMGGGFVVIGLAPNLAVLALGLLVWGVAASVYHPAGLSLISRGTRERGTAFAYHGAAGNVGVAIGPFLGAVLLAFFPWRVVALLLVVPVIVAIALAVRLSFDETARMDAAGDTAVGDGSGHVESLSDLLSHSKLLFTGGFVLVLFVASLYGLYYRAAFTFLPDILAGLPLFEPVELFGRSFESSQYAYSGLLMLGGLGQYAGGKLVDHVSAEYALVGTFAALAVVALVFVPAANAGLGPLLVVAGLLGFFVFMEAPINQEVISKYSAAEVRGLSFGYTYLVVFGIGALGASAAGVILTQSTPAVLFLLLTGLAVVAVLVGGYLIRSSYRVY